MSDPAILEAAERALNPYFGPPATETRLLEVHVAAEAVLAAVTPLIEEAALKRWHHDLAYVRTATLEEAAVVVEDVDRDVAAQNSPVWGVGYFAQHIRGTAAAIRALKVQPGERSAEEYIWRKRRVYGE
jgi:hypothetical protein